MRRILLLTMTFFTAACAGRRPHPETPPPPPFTGTVQEGGASWYGLEESGRPTASGEMMDPERFTAAHKTLPFGTVVRVDDLDTGRSVVVVINDRGPFVDGRIIDLSYASAKALGIVKKGVARVRIHIIDEGVTGPAPYTWRVQIGAFSEEARAREIADQLRRESYGPIVIHAQRQGSQILYKVWVGTFADRAEADRLAHILRAEGRAALVISTKANP